MHLSSCPLRHTSVSEEQQWFSPVPATSDSSDPYTGGEWQRLSGAGKHTQLDFDVCQKGKKIEWHCFVCISSISKKARFSPIPCVKALNRREKRENTVSGTNIHVVWFDNRDRNIFHFLWCHVPVPGCIRTGQENVPAVAQLTPQALLFKSSPFPDRVVIMEDFVYSLSDCTVCGSE